MAAIGGGSGSSKSNASSSASSHQAPKILLAKPTLVTTAKYNQRPGGGGGGGGPDDASSSLRSRLPSVGFLNLLSDSWDFHTDRFLPAMAKHCTVGIEPRITFERIILLDTQPVYSPSILAEMIRPDGSSIISVLGGEPLPAELAHELMGIQEPL
ncbi:unnamed protein product [Lactuca virosa]|uniref:Uncharacterized protein n=1 Tax=Lactuca virosa TaxID=75947 RepID=A0AAU9MAN0_9ASTR|nr:unnamed protein product [Lactuca virosa]